MTKNWKVRDLALALTRAPDADGWQAFDLLFRDNPQPMWIYDRTTLRFLDVNEAASRTYGYTRDEFLSMTLADIRPPDDVPRLKEIMNAPAEKGYKVSTGWQHRHKDGTYRLVTIHSHEITYHDYDAALIVASDVTELYELIDKLEAQTVYFQQLFSNSPDGIALIDSEGRAVDVNAAFLEIFGFDRDEVLGHSLLRTIIGHEETQEALSLFERGVERKESARLTTVRRHKDGRKVDVEVLTYPVKVKSRDAGLFAVYHDIGKRQQALEELEYQARHDVLTGLVNRSEFMRHVQATLDIAERNASRHAVLYFDIDQFKVINDSCGHSAGDRAIIELSRMLKSAVGRRDIIARLGGDEFGVLLPNCNRDNAMEMAQSLLEMFRGYRFTWNERDFPVAVSIGAAEVEAGSSVEEVMSAADAACHAAKEKGRNRIQRYDAADEHFVSRKSEMAWVSRLSLAAEKNRFVLFYQDIVALAGDGRDHREILIRYRDDDGRLVAPGLFVPSAERYNLMPSIDRWVLKTVCERSVTGSVHGGLLCVNVSGTTLSDEKYPDFVKDVLAATGTNPSSLCFEITETAAILHLALAVRFIDEMKSLGCSIALDDFGSGMSSFSYLRELNVDYLKIDGTFINNLHVNPVDRAMTAAINNVGRILGLKTIAEFVENDDILAHLREIGVDYAQGYGIHKPEAWLD